MPESRGGGSSGGGEWLSSGGTEAEHAPSWRTEGALVEGEEECEEEEAESSGSIPDTLDVDLGGRGKRKFSCAQSLRVQTKPQWTDAKQQ